MEGDLDETVQRCASLLTSDDGIGSACSLLMGLWREGSSDEKRMIFARLAQEVAASHGGTVLRHLLWRTLGQPYLPLDSQGQQNFLASVHCNLSLGMLTSSKVVVERCLREGLGLKDLWESGVGPKENGSGMRQGKTLDSGRGPKEEETGRVPEERETARQIYARLMLHIAHFSAIVRLSGELSIRPAVNNLVTLVVAGSLECLSNFARASKAFRDAIRDAAEEQNMFERFGDLLRPEHLTKIVPHTALEIRLSLASLAVSLAHSADSQLLQGRKPSMNREFSAASWKLAEERISGSFWTPVVCSWNLCAAGREPVVGKGFSKCGRCQVARYCSKEHQKLHWETHKKHCKTNQAKKDVTRTE